MYIYIYIYAYIYIYIYIYGENNAGQTDAGTVKQNNGQTKRCFCVLLRAILPCVASMCCFRVMFICYKNTHKTRVRGTTVNAERPQKKVNLPHANLGQWPFSSHEASLPFFVSAQRLLWSHAHLFCGYYCVIKHDTEAAHPSSHRHVAAGQL